MNELNQNQKIRVKKRGNALGIWFFDFLLKTFGLKSAYVLLEVVCAYYLFFDWEAVASAMAYIEKRFPHASRLNKYYRIHRLFVNQGRQLIDRHAILGRADYFTFQENWAKETKNTLQESSKGVILLTSHVGNWQVALRQIGHLKKNICIVMRPEDNAAVQKSLKLGNEERPVKVINPEGHLGGVLEMIQALEEGSVVCIMGDRAYGFDTVEVPFLGHPANFPYGAFSVAAAAGCPIIPFLTYKISERKYVVDVSHIWHPIYIEAEKKKDQLKKWVEIYVKLLEKFVGAHPYECFLFHDVWAEAKGV